MLNNKKISVRQFMILFILGMFSPMVGLPGIIGNISKSAGWLSPILSVTGLIILVYISHELFRKNEGLSLADIIKNTFGKVLGTVILAVYFIWISVLLAVYIRYYSERILSSIMPLCSSEFLIIVILALSVYAARSGIVSLARLGETLFNIFILIFLAAVILSFFDVKISNLLPVSQLDVMPLLQSVPYNLSVWGIFIFMFFLADKVSDVKNLGRSGIKTSALLCGFFTLMLVAVIGVLGSSMTGRSPQPFFIVIKNISVLSPLDRFESLLLSLWIVADFTIITLFILICANILKSTFKLTSAEKIPAPLAMIAFPMSMCISRNLYELEKFTKVIVMPVNLTLCFGVPFLLFLTAKFRKTI